MATNHEVGGSNPSRETGLRKKRPHSVRVLDHYKNPSPSKRPYTVGRPPTMYAGDDDQGFPGETDSTGVSVDDVKAFIFKNAGVTQW